MFWVFGGQSVGCHAYQNIGKELTRTLGAPRWKHSSLYNLHLLREMLYSSILFWFQMDYSSL